MKKAQMSEVNGRRYNLRVKPSKTQETSLILRLLTSDPPLLFRELGNTLRQVLHILFPDPVREAHPVESLVFSSTRPTLPIAMVPLQRVFPRKGLEAPRREADVLVRRMQAALEVPAKVALARRLL